MNDPNNVPPVPAAPTPPPPVVQKTSLLALVSLVLGILGLPFLWFLGIPAVICGHFARMKIRNSNGALKGDGLVSAGLTLGYLQLLAAAAFSMLIPAFQDVKKYSPEKAVLNNARQLAAAADQYFLDHKVQSCRSEDLIGPTNYVKILHPIAGEKYPDTFVQGRIITVTGIAGARTITYAP